MYLSYTLWSETNGSESRWFWIIDEIDEDNDNEKSIASGIENTEAEAKEQIRRYIPDA